MRVDPTVFVIGEDVTEGGPFTTTAGLADEFGVERVLDTPISEATICGIAVGAAQSGLRPVLEIMFIDFITLALDQLVNQAAKAHFMSGGQLTVPMVLRTQGGAGHRSGAQHSQSMESWLTHVPGLTVVMPSRAVDAAGLLASAIADPGPVVVVENKTLYFRKEIVPVHASRFRSEGGDPAPRPRRHRRRAVAARARGAGRRRGARRRGHRGRGDRPAHARAARPGDDPGVGPAHQPAGRRARGRRSTAGSGPRSRPRCSTPRSTISTPRSNGSARRSSRSRSARRWRTRTSRVARTSQRPFAGFLVGRSGLVVSPLRRR